MSSTTVGAELKGLRLRRDATMAELRQAREKLMAAATDVQTHESRLRAIEEQIKAFETKRTEIAVSEHAFVRWFERACGYDLDQVREEMLSDKARAAIMALGGSGRINIRDGLVLVVQNGTVVSVLAHQERGNFLRLSKKQKRHERDADAIAKNEMTRAASDTGE